MSTDAPDSADASSADEWFEDTLGWRVRFRCTPGRCQAPGADAPADHPVRCPDDMEPYVATTITERVPVMLATCSSGMGWYGWREIARPIVCETDAHCAQLQHISGAPQCVDGICQVPDVPLSSTDVLSLCLASVPRPPVALTYPRPADVQHAFDLADLFCPRDGAACSVPPECWPP